MMSKVMESDSGRVRVIYIAGWGRSGSTLLGNLLGMVHGCFSGGELRFFIERGIIEDRICGDGVRFSSHPIWRSVNQRVEKDIGADVESLRSLEQRLLGGKWPLVDYWTGWRRHQGAGAETYTAFLSSLYRAIHDVTDCDVIVDTSKYPVYAAWLGQVPGVELSVVHLVRDPRAVAWSWLRKKHQPDKGAGQIAERHPLLKSALQWNLINRCADGLSEFVGDRYVLMRYDDLIENPAAALRNLLNVAGLAENDVPAMIGNEIEMNASAAFSGNPDRFKSGPITLKIDDEWRHRMPKRQRAFVSSLNASLIRRYGFEK
jgi:hypothetical protein